MAWVVLTVNAAAAFMKRTVQQPELAGFSGSSVWSFVARQFRNDGGFGLGGPRARRPRDSRQDAGATRARLGVVGVSAVKDFPKAKSLKPRAGLVRPLLPGVRDPLIDRLAPGEALGGAVPVRDLRFAQLPAQQHDLPIHLAGEVEEADVRGLSPARRWPRFRAACP